MFEITADDIAILDDSQLRTLVGLLCEAELRSRGYSTAAVTWGGNQNAKDGGLDVRVSLDSRDWEDGFIPRCCTGFQVKRQDMPPRAIVAEMRPNGKLRPAIQELAESDGAYIIVSSQGTTSDSALTNRKKAIAEAANGLAGKLHSDFYDRTRLATWVRNHPGLVVWVRGAIGRAISGWEAFGPWAYPAEGTEAVYLVDDGVRIRDRSTDSSKEMSALDGLHRIREILCNAPSVVRLVGLSGVGKTRFVQALFDDRVGQDALDPALAVYTNMGNDPDPQPFKLASDLLANRARAILIVDNCPSDLHSRLSELVRARGGGLSILTVEYDIKDDVPEGTEVFEIRVASVELIEKILQTRFPKLSGINVRTAAEFSSGNARIAIALASTVSRGGTLARLTDAELFNRLFAQRQGYDSSLLEMAQACALVYSFNAEDLSRNPDAELHRLSGLVGASPEQAHRLIAELLRRDLAQRRGKWRAILPHALANHLATVGLQNIPLSRIEEVLTQGAPQRLTISFAKRLGYLERSAEARGIVGAWLGPRGWIGQHIWNLNEFGKSVFRNCLPAAPEACLAALEANLPSIDAGLTFDGPDYVAHTLRSLAWQADLFERCATLLQFLAVHGNLSIASEIHSSFFQIYLSGTHASIEQRVKVTRKLLRSENAVEKKLGFTALKNLLRCSFFTSHYDFQFGSHSRDYGYLPETAPEILHWYREALAVAEELALSDSPAAREAREIIAGSFRGLWSHVGLRDELEALSRRIADREFWSDGWHAVKQTRFYDEKNKDSENYSRLSALENALRPQSLVERIRAQVFANSGYDLDEVDANDSHNLQQAIERQQAEVIALAVAVAEDPTVLDELMPDVAGGGPNIWYFGMGLAQVEKSPNEIWDRMVAGFANLPEDRRDMRVLSGFLLELANRKSPLLGELLDEAVQSDLLASNFPRLLPSLMNVPGGIALLQRSLELGKAPIARYADVHFGRAVEVIPATDIANFIVSVSNVKGGVRIAIRMLGDQFFNDIHDKRPHAEPIVEAGRTILSTFDFDGFDDASANDYHLKNVIDVCATGMAGYSVVHSFCTNMRRASLAYTFWVDCGEVLKVLARLQPRATLDALLTGDQTEVAAGTRIVERASLHQGNPLSEIGDDVLLTWCSEGPANRYSLMAAVGPVFDVTSDRQPRSWRPVAMRLVHDCPDSLSVMVEIVARLRPMMWSGSRSTILRENVTLLGQFDSRGNPSLSSFIELKRGELIREAIEDQACEMKRDRERDETFE
ncbi:hypothetical protein F6X37_32635 [Paraburkholderia sp. 31.1]|uniref:hypothetical protein n=1 Tax=Paraburkholderia sp. 31.1 TaxID=2615205 RepID=UPI0016563383|nr:hypothetical protein [Paraburkholderia sp. 31.1]MBC8726109.1 hypothetical protein [Paraburkholderia sp. 31.1]